MSDPYIGEIRMTAASYAPRGYSECAGQMILIQDNTALYSLIGCEYGGDCRNTFALPDLRGRVPVGLGMGPGLPNVRMGMTFGDSDHTLTIAEMPKHNHTAIFQATGSPQEIDGTVNLKCQSGAGTETSPNGKYPAAIASDTSSRPNLYPGYSSSSNSQMALDAAEFSGSISGGITGGVVQIGVTGANQPFELYQPSLGIRFMIAINGLYPPRS